MKPYNWRDRALCAQVDTDAFFPTEGGSTRVAKTICARCSVRAECLQFAIEMDITEGVWGGLSGRQRKPLRTARQRSRIEDAA